MPRKNKGRGRGRGNVPAHQDEGALGGPSTQPAVPPAATQPGRGGGRGGGPPTGPGPSTTQQAAPAQAGALGGPSAQPVVPPAATQPGRGAGRGGGPLTGPGPSPTKQAAPTVTQAVPQQGAEPVARPTAWQPLSRGPGQSAQPPAAQPVTPQTPVAEPPQAKASKTVSQERKPGPVLVGQAGPSTEEIVQKFTGLQLVHKEYVEASSAPKRSGFGKIGKPIKLISNHYPVKIPDGYIYHYDVEIEALRATMTPDELKKEKLNKATPQQVSGKRLSTAISKEVMMFMFRQDNVFRGVLPAYDGNKSMFTRKPIEIGSRMTKIVSFREEGRDVDSHFKVSIQPVTKEGTGSNEINLNCLHLLFSGKSSFNVDCYQAFMALDIIMRHGPSLKLTPVGRSFFLPPRSQEEVHPLSEGKQIWFGHYQTIRPDFRQPVIIVDKSATTFYEGGPLKEYACKFLNLRSPDQLVQLRDADIKRLSNDLKNVQIRVTHLPYPRKYRILRLTRQSARDLKFPETQKDGKVVQTSVADYFARTYRPLKFPNFPCVQVNPENKKIYQPMEVCDLIEGQHYQRKLTDDQISEMIKFTCTKPSDRFDYIQQAFDKTAEYSKQYMREFGLDVKSRPLSLEGRVLKPPTVVYGGEKQISPYNGAWDLRDTKFFRGAQIKSWAIICMAAEGFCNMHSLSNFENLLIKMAKSMGMYMEKAKETTHLRNRGLPAILEGMQQKYKPELVIVVLKDRSSYSAIKQLAEVKLGLRTSCVQASNVVRKCNPQFICNLLQKMNAKFDGQNSTLSHNDIVPILQTPVLIIGVDVSHSTPGDKVKPSVAAAVGSLDRALHHYAVCIKVQANRNENKQHLEIVANLKEMVYRLLIAFFRRTNQKPEKVIIYRDGVSEGEFGTVCRFEIPKVDEAFRDIQKDGLYSPPVTFIVVQKRHHTRFVPENPRDGVGKCQNIPPGTTVDKEVIHPVYHDFFLCSHFGIQGTSRPAHYTVLRDDSKLSPDDLQKLSYQLCHNYVRCTRSISIPAPVMYAHLAADRARKHLACSTPDEDMSISSGSSDPVLDKETLEQLQKQVEVMGDLVTKMYFV